MHHRRFVFIVGLYGDLLERANGMVVLATAGAAASAADLTTFNFLAGGGMADFLTGGYTGTAAEREL